MFQHRRSDTLAFDYHPLLAAMTTEEKARRELKDDSTMNLYNYYIYIRVGIRGESISKCYLPHLLRQPLQCFFGKCRYT
jgi:hypothetical protein